MDIDAPRVRFGVPVMRPAVATAPQITISTWRVPPQPDPVLLLTSSTTLQIDALQVVYEWTSEDDVGTTMRALRVVPQRATTLDGALLARDEPEGRVRLALVSHDEARQLCRQFTEIARPTPPVPGPRFDPNHDTVAADVIGADNCRSVCWQRSSVLRSPPRIRVMARRARLGVNSPRWPLIRASASAALVSPPRARIAPRKL